ncbi:MAG: Uma2 family endonuclease [Myxococcales bacterium]
MARGRGNLAVMQGGRRATYDDLLSVPEHLVGEIINGELVASPRPAALHALATSRLEGELYGPFDRGRGGPGGWVLLFEPELHLLGHVLVPDVAGWRRERMPEVPDAKAFELAPDWICEVLSRSTAAIDRADKVPIYAQAGVAHVWLVDPVDQTVEALRLGNDKYVLLGTWRGNAAARIEPFDAIDLDLAALWSK